MNRKLTAFCVAAMFAFCVSAEAGPVAKVGKAGLKTAAKAVKVVKVVKPVAKIVGKVLPPYHR